MSDPLRDVAAPPESRLIALGRTNAEIGAQLFLSVRTVEMHRSHIQRKLGRTTRAELVRYSIEHGLLDA